jgi:hypothetical protein
MERKTKVARLLMQARRLVGWAVAAIVHTGCTGSLEPGETGSGIDEGSGNATGVDLEGRRRHPPHVCDAGKDATQDAGAGSDATTEDASTPRDALTSDDGSTDVLSTSDAQVDAESDVTVSDAGTEDSSSQEETGMPDAAIEARAADGAFSNVNAPTDAADRFHRHGLRGRFTFRRPWRRARRNDFALGSLSNGYRQLQRRLQRQHDKRLRYSLPVFLETNNSVSGICSNCL